MTASPKTAPMTPAGPRLPARLLASSPRQPRLAGAHPVTPVARRHEATSGFRSGVLLQGVLSLVAWLRPLVGLVPPSALRRTGGIVTAPAASPAGHLGWALQQRLVGGAVAVLVLVASVVGVSPVHTAAGGTGNVLGAGTGPRLAIGGTQGSGGSVPTQGSGGSDGGFGGLDGLSGAIAFGGVPEGSGPVADAHSVFPADSLAGLGSVGNPIASQDIEGFSDTPASVPDGVASLPIALPIIITESIGQGAFLADGTILKPIAVDTTAPDARTLLTKYTVRRGDTLTSIAHHFGLSLVTLYWANHLTTNLKTKTDLKVGRALSIPPVNGVLHIVTDTETLADISKRTGVSVNRIVQANGLKQPTVFVGQWIIVPGAKAKPIPVVAPRPKPAPQTTTARPTPKPVSRPATNPTVRSTYSAGGWSWPVPGGYISQYFHYGHWAIDIAGTYGIPVLAAKAGVVIFAGWKNNGGGWQVWISHGNGVYTTYNHMSSLTVGGGESVDAGRQVGRVGMTGHATGPHLHFEVWLGGIWNGGVRVNPLNYI